MKKRLLVLVLWSGMAWAQPIIPGYNLPYVPNRVPESADMREARFLFAEGQRLHRQGQTSRAVDLYRKALTADPGRLEYRPYLAQALESLAQHQDALEQYDLYLAEEGQDVKIRRARLLPLIGLKRWEEVDAELAVLESQHPDYLLYKGLSWLERRQPARAEGPLRAALALQGDRLDIRLNLVTALLLQNKSQEGLDLLPAGGTSPRADLLRGVALHQLNQPAEAEKVWRTLLPSQELVEATLNLATTLAERGQDAQALRLAAQALDQQPNSQAGRLLYARLLNRAARYSEALTVLRPLLEPDGFEGSRVYLHEVTGWTLLGLGRNQEALDYLNQAVKLGAGGPSLENNLALVLTRLSRLDEALLHQLKAVELAPQQASAWYLLGRLYEKRAQPKQAASAYEKYLALETDESAARPVRNRLKELR
ncbi:MAG: tetratricopeptide repeat protein [Candidatus Eremiobacteraeota bacterium]|nr:tetratricopeptide repeat protein [Candidatus Eremiobacteraeota bacterium]MCW5868983.1 tetratricopeptide repeat protein [Candidatus Eremiobacteraeota bacterium]